MAGLLRLFPGKPWIFPQIEFVTKVERTKMVQNAVFCCLYRHIFPISKMLELFGFIQPSYIFS